MKFIYKITILFLAFSTCIFALSPNAISIVGVGDLMLGTSFPDSSTLSPRPEKLLSQVESFIQSADFAVANLEGCLMDSGGTPKDCWGKTERCFIFRMPEHYVNYILSAGFDAISLANNHVRDMGYEAYRRSQFVCDSVGLAHAGIFDSPSTIVEKNDLLFGFAAFSPHWATARMYEDDKVVNIISSLADTCDIVVVMFHAGGEGEEYNHTPRETEIYKGTNRGNVYHFAHLAIDAGADVVFGSGPHVTRAVELYKDRFIAYSLGNFCTYKRFNLSGSRGVAPIMKVHTNASGEFMYAKAIAIRQLYPGVPQPDPQHLAIKELKQLTKEDFPEMDSVLVIDSLGYIYKR